MNPLETRRALKIGLITLFGSIITFLVTPLLLPMMLIFWVMSQVVFLGLKVKFGLSVKKPSGMDIVNGVENDISRPYINVAFRFANANPDVNKIKDRFQKVILDPVDEKGNKLFEKFTHVFEKRWGYYVWRKALHFDLDNHIKMLDPEVFYGKYLEWKQKKQGQRDERTNSALKDASWEGILSFLLKEFGSNPVKAGIPKWEFLILPEAENRYTTLFRVHHSISDGLYFVRLICECLADRPVDVEMPFKHPDGNIVRRVMKNILYFFLLPHALYRAITCKDRNPLHGAKLTGRKKYFVSPPFELSALKEIKKTAKVSINDLMFSCASAAATKHFMRRNASVENLTVLLAVNLQKPGTPLLLKNNFAVTSLKIPGSLKGLSKNKKWDILEESQLLNDQTKIPSICRLQIVKSRLWEARTDPCLMSLSWLLATFSYLLPAPLAEAMLSTHGITMDISNIRGPQLENFTMVDRASAEDIIFWVPDRDPLGIGVSILSYVGFIRVGLIVDEALMPDEGEGHYFLENFCQEVKSLQREISAMTKANDVRGETEFASLLSKDIP